MDMYWESVSMQEIDLQNMNMYSVCSPKVERTVVFILHHILSVLFYLVFLW